MTLEDLVHSPQLQACARQAPLGPHLDDLLAAISSVGYTPRTTQELVHGVIQFGAYLQQQGLTDLGQFRWDHVESYIATQPVRQYPSGHYHPYSRGVWAACHLWRYACAASLVPPEPTPPITGYAALLQDWLQFLARHRGLVPGSLALYRRHLQRFLEYLGPDASATGLHRLEVGQLRDYLRRACQARSHSHRKAVASTLRLFLRFAWSRGYLPQDLSLAIDRVPCFKHDRLPRGPRWEDAQRLLQAPDRTTPVGRRDYAILQLLLAYGVRAQQIGLLGLEDIDWRSGTLRFPPAKGGRAITVPLVPAVGEALLAYLQSGRPRIDSRRVFLSSDPPFPPLSTSAITARVTHAFAQTGVPSPHHGSHALRHAWATRMLDQGRPLKTIADLLGHRSVETTRLYTKANVRCLRTVGLSWPEEELP
ncbi:MAG: tyrosine-type recombinase/integrase [Candidatus Latescibacteria bacterium]|nr:tyrosine-type recombinase/integrase [Candidatus Latescibacterota bacterium]